MGIAAQVPWLVQAAILFLVVMVAAALLADWLAPFGYNDQDLAVRLKPPAVLGGPPGHLLGTDELGRDVLSRVLYSLRISLLTAIVGSLIGATIGTALGALSAHFSGALSGVLLVLIDFQASMPFIIFAVVSLAFLGSGIGIFVLLLGLYGWETYARLTRGLVLAANGRVYVDSLRSLGFGPMRIYLRHILPNIAGALLVQMSLNFPNIILMESGLSFLGLGVQPPLSSLGLMIGTGRQFLLSAWWMCVVPGVVIFLTTLSVTFIGDWLRVRLDAQRIHR